MFFDVDEEEVRRAIRIRAAKDGTNTSEVVVRAVKAYLSKEIQEAREALASGAEAPRTRRGPKAKGE